VKIGVGIVTGSAVTGKVSGVAVTVGLTVGVGLLVGQGGRVAVGSGVVSTDMLVASVAPAVGTVVAVGVRGG
jgi:hypothetical protein